MLTRDVFKEGFIVLSRMLTGDVFKEGDLEVCDLGGVNFVEESSHTAVDDGNLDTWIDADR